MKAIIDTLHEIKQIYTSRGFRIEHIHGDNEFNKEGIKQSQLPALFHIYGKDEHVGLIERSNRMVKNKSRTITHAAPYQYIPKVMTIGLIAEAIKWINAFPSMNGVSKTMSPATIVEGIPKPNMKYKRIVFGSQAMVYTGTNNRLDARSVPAIALNSSNLHGGHYFMSLYSGKRIHSYEWKEVPIDDEVIARVETLGTNEEATKMKRGYYPVFTWKQRVLYDPELNVNDAVEDNIDVNILQNQGAEGELDAEENMEDYIILEEDGNKNDDNDDIDNEGNYITDENNSEEENEEEDDNDIVDEIIMNDEKEITNIKLEGNNDGEHEHFENNIDTYDTTMMTRK